MARNEEKAQSMLNRWLDVKKQENEKPRERRPYLASECDQMPECEKWRFQILREISKKVSVIQNPALGEHKIRDLNDEINKLMREKRHWEVRIVELGGPDYQKVGSQIADADGTEVASSRGYKYFGAAKDLPGVAELFQKDAPKAVRRTRYEMFKRIDADYYGYRDDDDGTLEPQEAEAERKAVEAAVDQWKVERLEKDAVMGSLKRKANELADAVTSADNEDDDELGLSSKFVSHVPLPNKADIEKLVLEKRKKELMKKYISPALAEQSDASKEFRR